MQTPGAAPRKLRAAWDQVSTPAGSFAAARVIDLCCGAGRYLEHFAPGSLGIDRDPAVIEGLVAKGLDAQCADLDRPGWSETLRGRGPFDAAWLCDCLVHLAEPRTCLTELAALLRPGAPLLVAEWVLPEPGGIAAPLRRALCLAVPGARAHWRHPEHLHRFTASTLAALLAQAGFRVERQYLPILPPRLANGRAASLLGSFWPARLFVARRAEPGTAAAVV